MKKLKKVLSLLLVAAMVFSFSATALAYEDYSAADSGLDTAATTAECYEAVQAMTNLGIIEGTGNDYLEPDGQFTRGQAAKIITYMMIGSDKASVLTADGDVFSDVPATAWYAPYVEAAADQDVISGYEDGTYRADEDLTVNQWLKLLVAAIMEDSTDLVGPNWAKNTVIFAERYGIITADEYALSSEGLTREAAILYAWRALNFEFNNKASMAEKIHGVKGYTDVRNIYGDYVSRDLVTVDKTVLYSVPYTAEKLTNTGIKTADYPNYKFIVNGVEVTGTVPETLGGLSSVVHVYAAKKTVVVIDEQVEVMTEANVKAWDDIYDAATLVVDDVITYTQGNTSWTTGKDETVVENISVLNATIGQVTARIKDIDDNYVKLDYGEATYFALNAFLGAGLMDVGAKYKVYIDAYGNIVGALDYIEPQEVGTLVFMLQVSVTHEVTTDPTTFVTTSVDEIWAQYLDLATGEIETVNLKSNTDVDGVEMWHKNSTDASKEESNYFITGINRFVTLYSNGDYKAYATYRTADTTSEVNYAILKDEADNAFAPDEELMTADTVNTVIEYQNYYDTVNYKTTYGYDKDAGASADHYVYATFVKGADGLADQLIVIKPYVAPAAETKTVYGMFMGVREEVLNNVPTQYYQFTLADGTVAEYPVNLTTVDYEKEALHPGFIYKVDLTADGEGTFWMTDSKPIEETPTINGMIVYVEGNYIHIGDLVSNNQYEVADGVVYIDADGNITSVSLPGTNKNGVSHPGDNVSLYTNDDGVVVYIVVNDEAPVTAE